MLDKLFNVLIRKCLYSYYRFIKEKIKQKRTSLLLEGKNIGKVRSCYERDYWNEAKDADENYAWDQHNDGVNAGILLFFIGYGLYRGAVCPNAGGRQFFKHR